MRLVIASLLVVAAPALAQAPSPNPQSSVLKKSAPAAKDLKLNCADCGEIRSVRKVTKEIKEIKEDASTPQQAGGLVASIPLGGGKAKVGSSTRVGDEAVRTTTLWEVTLRYDDGRYRLLMLDKQPDFTEGDRVRVDSRGHLLPP